MHIVSDSLAPCSGRLVFLDTADWSYLETARDPPATAKLRALAGAGQICFVVTLDHLIEIAGLRRGLRERLRFMRDFPGTRLYAFGGAQLLRLAALEFALNALGAEQGAHPFHVFSMREKSLDELVAMTRQTRVVRFAHRFRARIMARTADTSSIRSRQEREAEEKLHRLARIGDREHFESHLSKITRPLRGIQGYVQRAASPLLLPLFGWASSRGLVSRARQSDFLFDQLVTSVLPPKLSTNSDLIAGLAKLWAKPEALALMSPALACVKAIAKAQTPTLDVQKIESTEHDKHHATFAPLVAVFTCDKRNQPIVAQTMKLARLDTHVLRTGCISDVVSVLNQR